MSRILALLRRDYAHVTSNVIALLVCVGLAVMPSLYAWFNIAGGWDPYANTSQLKVALANSDEGVQGSIIPYRVNVGERVISELSKSDKIGYVATSEDDAVDGVSSGEYYAAVVIPRDFSAKLLSVLASDPTHPQLDYYVNQKRNAIASIVTGKASGSVQTMIDEGLTQAVSTAAADVMGELSGLLDDDSVASLAGAFGDAMEEMLRTLQRASAELKAYQGVVASVRGVAESANSVLGTEAPSLDVASKLSDAASGVRDFETKASAAKERALGAIDKASGSLDEVTAAVNEALDAAGGDADQLRSALDRVLSTARERVSDLQSLRDGLATLDGQLRDFSAQLDRTVGETDINIQYAHTVSNDISDLLSRVDNALGYLNDLIATTTRAIDDIGSARGDLDGNRQQIAELADKARASFQDAQTSYDEKLKGSLERLAEGIDTAADDATNVSAQLKEQVGKISPMLSGASSDLKGLEDKLVATAAKTDGLAEKVQGLQDKLNGALASGNLDMLRTIFSADPGALVSFLSAPVDLEREAVYAIENNGSAMAPYYTTMALWVGGTLMGILFYAAVSRKALEETGASQRHAYFARLLFFLTVGFFQATLLLLGDLFFLGIQCVHPWLFLLTGWLASCVFINIVYALSTAFGDVGKAIGVLIMVIQVAGSGGTFPVEMLPPLFQTLYRFLPFVYSETAMREAICGVYGDHWLVAMGTLALYLIPALLVGLLLAKPFVPVNEWIEEHLEKTKFM